MPTQSILLVEDNEDNSQLVRFLLERAGYQVLDARTGQQGLDLARQAQPDLILMDWQMPDMDGLEVTRAARGAGIVPCTPLGCMMLLQEYVGDLTGQLMREGTTTRTSAQISKSAAQMGGFPEPPPSPSAPASSSSRSNSAPSRPCRWASSSTASRKSSLSPRM